MPVTRNDPHRVWLPTAGLLFAAALLGSCGTVAANDPEIMSIEEFEQGAETMSYDQDAQFVWLRAKETLVHLSSRQPDFNDDTMRGFATVEDGSIQIGIVALGDNSCRMAVRAREYGLASSELAVRVLNRIHEEIEP
jgi:hypothetical protein